MMLSIFKKIMKKVADVTPFQLSKNWFRSVKLNFLGTCNFNMLSDKSRSPHSLIFSSLDQLWTKRIDPADV